MFNLSKLSLRCMHSTTLRTILRTKKANHSTARPTVVVRTPIDTESANESSSTDNLKQDNISQQPVKKVKELHTTGLVAAAFASLQEEKVPDLKQKPTFIERKILKATTLNELLALNEDNGLSRHDALKIVSTLAQWSSSGKIELVDFETDPRFVKLCRILSRGLNRSRAPPRAGVSARGDDLSMVLGVTGDDEAAKLVASITLPQMIKVMSSLAQKKRRSTPLLRSLAYNISRNTAKLDLKQCADLLYSITILNFPDTVLLERISNDTIEGLESNTDRSAVIGSILTSIGLLRYRDPGVLDALSEWMLKYQSICRSQDISALFQTLAVINHQPASAESLYQVFIPQLHVADAPKPSVWLDIIWSLVILDRATSEHIASALEPEFISKLQKNSTLTTSLKVKLLNINAAAKLLLPKYTGPLLEENSDVYSISITRTKEKQLMVTSMLDSLGSLFSSSAYLKSNVNSGMGFLIDGECVIDKKCNPVPVAAEQSADQTRVAIIAYDYHDLCRESSVPHGANILTARLLQAQGYKLMIVPYTDFNARDKLVQRVQYLEKQLKYIASQV